MKFIDPTGNAYDLEEIIQRLAERMFTLELALRMHEVIFHDVKPGECTLDQEEYLQKLSEEMMEELSKDVSGKLIGALKPMCTDDQKILIERLLSEKKIAVEDVMNHVCGGYREIDTLTYREAVAVIAYCNEEEPDVKT